MTALRQSIAPAAGQSEMLEPPEISLTAEPIAPSERLFIVSRLLWEHRQVAAAVVLKGTALFLLIAFLIPSSYESVTRLMPPDQGSTAAMSMLAALGSGMGGGSKAIGMFSDLLGMKSSGALFISVLRSETVEDRLINRFDLRGVYWVSTYRAARKKLDSRTDITEDRKSGVISITVMDRNPQRAAALARAYVEELDRLIALLNTSAAHRERVFLEERLRAVKQELDQDSQDFSKFASQNTAIDIKEQGKAMVEAAAGLQGQLIAAESQLGGLQQIYTANNVRVRTVQGRIAELRTQLQKLGGVSSPGSGGFSDAEPNYPSIRQLPILGLTYFDLFRRVKVQEAVFEALTKEYELAKVQEAKEVPSVKVLVVGQPPERRSGPPRLLITLGGALLSLCVVTIWLFGSEVWAAKDTDDPHKAFLQEVATTTRKKLTWRHARDASARVIPVLRNRFNGKHNPPG